jgi:iron complex outermembrane receptor protein
MKIVTIFCSLLLLFFLRVNAQSLTKIEGYVFSEDGLPLENVNVIISGSAVGTATDERGFFELQNLFAGEYTIAVNHIGYEKSI